MGGSGGATDDRGDRDDYIPSSNDCPNISSRSIGFGLPDKNPDLSAFAIHIGRIVEYTSADTRVFGVYHEVNDQRGTYSMQFNPCIRQMVGGKFIAMHVPTITHNFSGTMAPMPYKTIEELVNDLNDHKNKKA